MVESSVFEGKEMVCNGKQNLEDRIKKDYAGMTNDQNSLPIKDPEQYYLCGRHDIHTLWGKLELLIQWQWENRNKCQICFLNFINNKKRFILHAGQEFMADEIRWS